MPNSADPEAVREFAQVNDPLEPTNRTLFAVNRALDDALLKPVATIYRDLVPDFARQGVRNVLANLRMPRNLTNDVLQGEGQQALVTLSRFFLNSTIGVLGLFDVATEMGLQPHEEDFGQTLAVWGAPSGPYLMLPLFGPSNPRDTIGLVVDILTDPLNIWASNAERAEVAIGRAAAETIDNRSRTIDLYDDLEKSSLDFYAAVRSLSRQRRVYEISNGKDPMSVGAPGVDDDAPVMDK